MTILVADPMPDIRYWLRTQPDLQAIHNGRVFFRIPNQQSQFPLLRIYRHGGGITSDGGDARTSTVNVTVEAWHNVQADYNLARQLAVALESALWTLPPSTLLNPGSDTVAYNAEVTSTIDMPDPESGWPRLICDTRWVIQGL